MITTIISLNLTELGDDASKQISRCLGESCEAAFASVLASRFSQS